MILITSLEDGGVVAAIDGWVLVAFCLRPYSNLDLFLFMNRGLVTIRPTALLGSIEVGSLVVR